HRFSRRGVPARKGFRDRNRARGVVPPGAAARSGDGQQRPAHGRRRRGAQRAVRVHGSVGVEAWPQHRRPDEQDAYGTADRRLRRAQVEGDVRRMIAGAGVDVAPIARVARLVRDHEADLDRIFTAREREHCDAARPAARDGRYAAAFAAKEAVFKALGTGWRSDLEWSDVDTRTVDAGGAIALSGGVGREAARQGVVRVFVRASITRVCGVAPAVAVLGAPAAQARALQPLAWSDVVAAYGPVRDYTAEYDKYERAIDNGDLQRIKLAFRKPL